MWVYLVTFGAMFKHAFVLALKDGEIEWVEYLLIKLIYIVEL